MWGRLIFFGAFSIAFSAEMCYNEVNTQVDCEMREIAV